AVPAARTVASAIAVLVAVAVRDRRLMLHAEVRRLDELEAVLVPRIGAEPVLEARDRRLHLRELPARGLELVVERPVVQRQYAILALVDLTEMRVAAGVDRDVVVVDRVPHEPLECCPAVLVHDGPQPPVRHVDHRMRYRDRYALAV